MCLFLNSLMEHGNWIWHSRDAWHFFTLRFVFSTWTFKCGLKFLFRFSTDLLLARCSICNVLYRRECDCLGVSQRHVLCSFLHCNDSTCLFSSVLSVFNRNRFFLVLSLVLLCVCTCFCDMMTQRHSISIPFEQKSATTIFNMLDSCSVSSVSFC
jgi:hypothetical protein